MTALAAQPFVEDPAPVDDPGSPRAELIGRYRRLRSIGTEVHGKALALVSEDAMLKQAGRLGVRGPGKGLVVGNPIVMDYIFDLLLYTAPAGRSRAIDRCGRTAGYAPGSEHALTLQAMRQARFAVLRPVRRHEIAGLVVTDVLRQTEVWLVDLGLEASWRDNKPFAARLYAPAEFSVTAGVIVPMDLLLLQELVDELPRFKATTPADLIEDRRFAEKLYRIAFQDGTMDVVRLQRP